MSSSCYYSENSVAFIGTTFIDFAVKLSVNAEVIFVEGKMVFFSLDVQLCLLLLLLYNPSFLNLLHLTALLLALLRNRIHLHISHSHHHCPNVPFKQFKLNNWVVFHKSPMYEWWIWWNSFDIFKTSAKYPFIIYWKIVYYNAKFKSIVFMV